MRVVERSAVIAAPPQRIWSVLAALDKYPEWEGGYVSAKYASKAYEGVGVRREVRLKSPMGARRALHEATKWEARKVIAWRAVSSNFPFLRTAEQTVTLTPAPEGAQVTNRVEYDLKYGLLGSMVNAMMFRRVVTGAVQGFLDSLRMAVEQHPA